MYSGLIITNDPVIQAECLDIAGTINNLNISCISSTNELIPEINISNCLFILISELNKKMISQITKFRENMAGPVLLFYNHSINYDELPVVNAGSKIKMIVGDKRQLNLKNHILKLKSKFWRRIPYKELGINYNSLSPRMKLVMEYIETEPVHDCNINAIAFFLNISPGYFSQEFKRETKKSFRTFMQSVISYYENIIFSQLNLSTKSISKILGYSELSSFSRSFKKRNGMSPSKYKKIIH